MNTAKNGAGACVSKAPSMRVDLAHGGSHDVRGSRVRSHTHTETENSQDFFFPRTAARLQIMVRSHVGGGRLQRLARVCSQSAVCSSQLATKLPAPGRSVRLLLPDLQKTSERSAQ